MYESSVLFNLVVYIFFFFKQKTAYEMRISDWSSDVCSSDLPVRRRYDRRAAPGLPVRPRRARRLQPERHDAAARRPAAGAAAPIRASLHLHDQADRKSVV